MNRFLRTHQRGADSDRGLSLIELIFALVLSTIIGGVIVAALITSLNVANATTDQVSDSTDAGLIAAFLTRDAQSAGATDPTTATRDASVGVSTSDWSGCDQAPFALVVRFSWIEHTSSSVSSKVVVTYAFDGGTTQLIRRLCRDSATPVDVALASGVADVSATCQVVTDCTGTPVSVSLVVVGSGTRAPFEYTVTASLRGDTQTTPTVVNSTPVPLLALGAGAGAPALPCPNVNLAGTGPVFVRGNVLVDSQCGATPIGGNQSLLQASGTTSTISGIVDPFLARVPPPFTCDAAGTNPPEIGLSADSNTTVVYPQLVTLTEDTMFQSGRFVFCNGVQFTSGRITGTDVLLYIAGGTFDVGADATVDLTGRLTSDANLSVWVASLDQTVTITGGTRATNFRGLIYAPKSTLEVASATGVNIGGLIVRHLTTTGAGQVRLGLPLPSIAVSPTSLPLGTLNVFYSVELTASPDPGPHTWTASGLPAGLVITGLTNTTATISGTPTSPATASIIVTVFDSTGAGASFDYTLSIDTGLGIFAGHSDVGDTGRPGEGSFTDPPGIYTIAVGKGGIGGTSDGFQFIYRSMTGDGRLTARVVSLVSNDNGAQAGVMFRETLDVGSSHVTMGVTQSNGGEFLVRDGTGAPTTVVTNGSPPAPYWVRLTRVGNLFTAERSADGLTWLGAEQRSVTMSSTIYIGLAIATHNNSANLATADFDNVLFEPPPVTAPALTATAASLAYTENAISQLDSGITAFDVDSANLTSATVAMTTAYLNGEDTLAFVNQNGITGTWSPATGVLGLSGSATMANYQAAIRSITYRNTSENPTTATRTVTFVVNDGVLDSNIASRTITVTSVNDVPAMSATAVTLAYTENATTVLDSGLTVADLDNPSLTSATVAMTTAYVNGQDTLAFVNQNGITGTWTPATGVLSLSGASTLANYQSALRSITYNNNSNAPNTTTRTVTFRVNDGVVNSNTVSRTITLTAVNDAPVVTTTLASLAYTENASTLLDPAMTVTEVDAANLASATVTMTAAYVNGQDTLAFVNQNGITGAWTPATGVLALSGSATAANYQIALRSISYNNSSNNPSTGTRTVTFVANDGALDSNIASRSITITSINDAPVNSVPGGQATSRNTAKVFSAGTLISTSDSDAGSSPVRVQLVSTNGATTLSGTGGLTFSVGDGIADTTMTFTGTIANINVALAGMSFNPTTAFVGASSLQIVTNDQGNTGTGAVGSDSDTITITVVNAPVVTTTGSSLAYLENSTTVVDSGLTVTDADSANLASATVTMTTAYVNGQDTLAFTTQFGITGTWTASTGVLALSGSTTVANYRTVLRSVTYSNNSNTPDTTTRTVTFLVNDGLVSSNTASRTITVTAVNDAPVVTATGGSTAYTENGTTAVEPSITVTDADSAFLSAASVTITTNRVAAQDTLAFVDQNGITGSWTASSSILVLTGSATVAQYQAALRSVTYNNSSNAPTTSTRTVAFRVFDGIVLSNVANRTITLAAVNDAPVNGVPGNQTTARNVAEVFSAANSNLISISDIDAGANSVQVRLIATNGTATLSRITGLAFSVGDGTTDPTMTFTGTITNVNAALAGMRFTPVTNFTGTGTLRITTIDQGFTGSGGALNDDDTISIAVT